MTAEETLNLVAKQWCTLEDIMNLYPSEARFLINLLNRNVNKIEISKDWMDELKRKKEEYKKSKEGE